MSLSSITVLECRQKVSQNIKQNGNWETILTEPIKIDPGDTIQLRNVFIDTVSQSSGDIIINQDTPISISNVVYNYNWETSNKTFEPPGGPNDYPDGNYYILCTSTPPGSLSDYIYIEQVKFSYNGEGGESWGGITVTFQYTDINGDTATHQYQLPEENKTRVINYTLDINLIAKVNTFILTTSKSDLDLSRTKYDGIQTTQPVTQTTYSPKIFTTTFTLPAGSYTPDNLAEYITSQISVNSTSKYVTDDPVNSNFLHDSDDFDSATNGPTLVRSDAEALFTYSKGSKRWIGSNQMSLIFDDSAQQKFQWQYTHMPFYDNTGNIVAKYVQKGASSEYFTANKAGGVFFTALEPVTFWQNQLKFDLSSLIINFSHVQKTVGSVVANLPESVPLVEGKNMTGGFKGLDIAVQKNNNFYQVPPIAGLTSIINNQVIPISATQITKTNDVDEPYFLVDINTLFYSNYLGQFIKSNSIQGIVSRYYSVDSYTTAGTESSIAYQHISDNSLLLTKLVIRILGPDGSVPNNIGDDNTIFLEIIKAKPLQPFQPKKQLQNK